MKKGVLFIVLLVFVARVDVFSEQISDKQQGHLSYISNVLRIEWIKIPGGKFKMGSTWGEKNESPVHTVFLDDYSISKHEITVEQFSIFVQETGYRTDAEKRKGGFIYINNRWERIKDATWKNPYYPQKRNHPVVLVSSNDAINFCRWLSQKTGKNILLPTEAQWEKAARGIDERKYPWGNSKLSGKKLNGADLNCDMKWSNNSYDDKYKYTSPVGKFHEGASPYGVMDMAGNVWEWCRDQYKADYYIRSVKKNPKGPKAGFGNTFRGGSWYCEDITVTTTVRGGHGFDYYDNGLGFRVVLED